MRIFYHICAIMISIRRKMESNTNQNITGGGATEVAGTAGANNQGAVAGQSVPATSSATDVAGQSAPATGGQSLASELEKELETTPAVDAGPEPEPAPAKSKKKKSGGGLIIAMVFVILLAAGGIGFGVWAMMDGNQQKEELNSQITSLKKQNSELMEKISDETTDNTDCIVDKPTTDNDVDLSGYIYIEAMGIKIKKPDNFQTLVSEYSYSNGYPQAADSFEIRESQTPGAGITITTRTGSCGESTDYVVCVDISGEAVSITEAVGELSPGTDSGMSEAFRSHFMNAENYSAI